MCACVLVCAGLKQPFHQFFPLESVLLGVQDWEKTAKRLVLGECVCRT